MNNLTQYQPRTRIRSFPAAGIANVGGSKSVGKNNIDELVLHNTKTKHDIAIEAVREQSAGKIKLAANDVEKIASFECM